TAEAFTGHAVVLVPDLSGKLTYPRAAAAQASLKGSDLAVAQWVLEHGVPAGLGTETLTGWTIQYFPLVAGTNACRSGDRTDAPQADSAAGTAAPSRDICRSNSASVGPSA